MLRFAWLPRLQQLALTDNALPNVWPLPPTSFASLTSSSLGGEGVKNATTVTATVTVDLPPPPPAPAAAAAAAPVVTGVEEVNEGKAGAGDDSTYVPKMVEHAAIPKEAITGADR